MAYLYPWGNTQQLNLDWILQKIKELESANIGSVLDEVANALISATYARQAYDRSDIVFYDGKLYRANQAIPAPGEVWTPAHWDEILLGDTVSNLVQYVAALSNDQIANSSSVSGTHTSDALDTLKTQIENLSFDSDSVSNESQVAGDNVSDALDNLNTAITNNQLNVATVESGLIATQNYYNGDLVIVNGRLRRVIATILSGETFVSGTNIVTTELANEMQMVEYQGSVDPDFADMGADSFYLRCYTYFHTFGIVWLSFYTPAVTPNTFITIGNFPATCTPAGTYSITWTGQKGGTYLIEFGSNGVVRMYCTDTTPQAQFIRCYIPLLVNT